jgi:hypothetical protein
MFFSLKGGAVCSTLFLFLTACGGGDGGDAPKLLSGSGNITTSVQEAAIMSCQGSENAQCSGDKILGADNGVALTASGVQTYGVSTNDLMTPNPDTTQAFGLKPATGGKVEVRVKRNASGVIDSVAMLMSDMGLSWDGKNERPLVIETFSTRQGRAQLDSKGQIVFGPLPPISDTNFYDFPSKGAAGTQANYANNIYFPRSQPVRCPTDKPDCPTVESPPLLLTQGDWKTGGSLPDTVIATHLHSDGATEAGDEVNQRMPPAIKDQFFLQIDSGLPYPGFKGYRNYYQWSYGWANLAGWITQDTVMINEWGGNNEHNKMRRGYLAFGEVTNPTQMPTTGTATYTGTLRGWFSNDGVEDSNPIIGTVTAVVDFARQTVQINFSNTRLDVKDLSSVPISFTTTTNISSGNLANYFTGSVNNGSVSGGLGARFFGPVTTNGGITGPAEVAGSYTFQNPNNGPVAIGGFLLKKQ